MKELKFKTNINCGGCIATVTPVLNKLVGENNWEVDIKSATKMLTIHSDNLPLENLVEELKSIGYNVSVITN